MPALNRLARQPNITREDLTLSTAATPFGCCNFFDDCSDGIMSLHYAGQLPLLDWMGFNATDVCLREMEYISYVRPARTQGRTPSAGHLADPCDSPNGIEFGSCKLTLEDFGRYGRVGKVRDMFKPVRWCKSSPRTRLDGSVVTDEREWDMRFAMDVMLNDIQTDLINGSTLTAGQFDGLERLVRTGYDCSILDSIVVDWNGNSMNGGAGITWNGKPIADTYNFVDVLISTIRRIKTRIGWSPVLRTQRPVIGDMILVMPSFMINCLLDSYTCWSVCDGSQYNQMVLLTAEARAYRNSLLGGLFGNGRIFVDGFEIPLMAYDFGLINGPTTGDVYLLTGSWGGVRMWEGEHLSADVVAQKFGQNGYTSTDGGRVLVLSETDNNCYLQKLWMRPRLWNMAPWANIRFQDVVCTDPMGPLSGDPDETSFYPLASFEPAVCP